MKLDDAKEITVDEVRFLQPHPYQRKMMPVRVQQYSDSIKSAGYWKSHPIVWFSHQGQKVIIWGHHRRAACLQTGSGAYAVEASEVTFDDTIDLISQENWATWKADESIALEARRGNTHYLALLKYINKGLSMSMAVSLLSGNSGNGGGKPMENLKKGRFKLMTIEKASIITDLFDRFPNLPMLKNTNFVKALARCMFLDEFEIERLIRKLEKFPVMLENRSTVQEFSKLIETMYNYREGQKVPLSFLADESAKARTFCVKSNVPEKPFLKIVREGRKSA